MRVDKRRHSGVLTLIILVCVSNGWCQDVPASRQFSFLLETAVRKVGSGRAGFDLVDLSPASPSEPRFQPTKGLDSEDAIPFLVGVLRGESNWATDSLFRDTKGIYFHIARCYAALSLGAIGDEQALRPLTEIIERSDVTERASGESRGGRQRYLLADYAILALGYLGDPRGVDAILRALPMLGQRYQYAAFALALLGDTRGAMPLIQHASNVGALSYNVHCCLEDLTHARFPIRYMSERRTYRAVDFPELGELPADRIYLNLWQYWSRKGGEFAERHAETMYVVWKRRSAEGRDHFTPTSEKLLFDEMTRGGLAALPYIMERIEKGDGSLVSHVPQWVQPVRENQFERSLISQLPKGATRSECLEWWHDNSGKYAISFAGEARSGPSSTEGEPKSTK